MADDARVGSRDTIVVTCPDDLSIEQTEALRASIEARWPHLRIELRTGARCWSAWREPRKNHLA